MNADVPDTFLDGYYNVNFDIAPIEFEIIENVYNRSSAIVFLDRETLSLSGVTNNLEGFNPLNSEIAVIEAEYSISEGAFITSDVIDEQQNIICSIYNQSYVSAGSHNLTWNGKNNSNVRADDGIFYFSIRASQPETGIDLASYGVNFVMDTTPPSFSMLLPLFEDPLPYTYVLFEYFHAPTIML